MKTLEYVFGLYIDIGYFEGRLAELDIHAEYRGYTESESKDYDEYMMILKKKTNKLKKYEYLKTQEVKE